MFGQLAKQPLGKDPSNLKNFKVFNKVFSAAPVPFAIRLWDGSEWCHGNAPPRFTLSLKHPAALQRILWSPNELSLGESYIYDGFDIIGDLEASFKIADYLISRQWPISEKLRLGRKLLSLNGKGQGLRNQPVRLRGRAHTKQRDAQAVQYHYNISNDFYKLWLDQRMIYSCAVFHSPSQTLDEAQLHKLDYICRKLRLKKGEKLLDIGCGWGGLIMYAAEKYGVEALGITLSQPQADLAEARINSAGLSGRCRVSVCDYRDMPADQSFDKLVSVGMVEHVGEAKLPEYFQKAYGLLKQGGVFLNHGITNSMTSQQNKGPSFIDKYVFPDGELLPISVMLREAEEAGFEVRDVEGLREHYALTLRHWVRRLEAQRDQATELTSPETYRIWRIYMAGSAHGFETGKLGLYQSLLVKSGSRNSNLPLTRCDWYRQCLYEHH
ncbi:MAG: class I SAM-dependent methyltransferase [Desulfuromonadales bacterium]